MKRFLFHFSAVLIGIVLSIFFAEGALRIWQIGYGNGPFESDPVLHHRHPSNYTFLVHTPSEEYGGHYVRYDFEGLISNPNPSERSSDPFKYRVAVMGDSFAEAAQVAYSKSFAGLVEQFSGGVCEIKNYGVSSYSPVLYLLQWKTAVQHFKPTHVFLLLFSNDIRDDEEYRSKAVLLNDEIVAVPGPGNDGWQRLLRKSYLVRFFRKTQLKVQWFLQPRSMQIQSEIGGYLEESPQVEPLTEKMLLALASEMKQSNAKLILTAVPSKYQITHPEERGLGPEFSDTVKTWAREHAIDFLDLVPAFQEAANRVPLFFKQDIHFNENGHRVVFETIKAVFPELFR